MTRNSSGRPPCSCASRSSWSIAGRKAATGLPQPVGAAMDVCSPRRRAGARSAQAGAALHLPGNGGRASPASRQDLRHLSEKAMTGMLDLEQLRALVSKDEIETVVVGFTDHYGRLLGKRFDAEMFVEEICSQGAHACDYLLTVDMEMEPVPGYRFASWELGYGDFHLVPDLGTLRLASWLDKTALVPRDVESEKTHDLVGVGPRSILRQQVDAASALGYSSFAATELEHYLFRTSYRDAARQGYRDLEPAGWYLEDYHILQGTRTEGFHAAARRHLKLSGVPVETSQGEWGQGRSEERRVGKECRSRWSPYH